MSDSKTMSTAASPVLELDDIQAGTLRARPLV